MVALEARRPAPRAYRRLSGPGLSGVLLKSVWGLERRYQV